MTVTRVNQWSAPVVGTTTVAVSPSAVGNLMVVATKFATGSVPSGGGVATWVSGGKGDLLGDAINTFWGVVTTTGASTLTFSGSGSDLASAVVTEYSSSLTGYFWSADNIQQQNVALPNTYNIGTADIFEAAVTGTPVTAPWPFSQGEQQQYLTAGSGWAYPQYNGGDELWVGTAKIPGTLITSSPTVTGASGYLFFHDSAGYHNAVYADVLNTNYPATPDPTINSASSVSFGLVSVTQCFNYGGAGAGSPLVMVPGWGW